MPDENTQRKELKFMRYQNRAGKVKDAAEANRRMKRSVWYLRRFFNKKTDTEVMLFHDGEWILTNAYMRQRTMLHQYADIPILLHVHQKSVQMCRVRGAGLRDYNHDLGTKGGYAYFRKKGDVVCHTCQKLVPDDVKFQWQLFQVNLGGK